MIIKWQALRTSCPISSTSIITRGYHAYTGTSVAWLLTKATLRSIDPWLFDGDTKNDDNDETPFMYPNPLTVMITFQKNQGK